MKNPCPTSNFLKQVSLRQPLRCFPRLIFFLLTNSSPSSNKSCQAIKSFLSRVTVRINHCHWFNLVKFLYNLKLLRIETLVKTYGIFSI